MSGECAPTFSVSRRYRFFAGFITASSAASSASSASLRPRTARPPCATPRSPPFRQVAPQHRAAPAQLRVELLAEAVRRRLLQKRPLGELLVGERLLAHVLEKRRVDLLHPRD